MASSLKKGKNPRKERVGPIANHRWPKVPTSWVIKHNSPNNLSTTGKNRKLVQKERKILEKDPEQRPRSWDTKPGVIYISKRNFAGQESDTPARSTPWIQPNHRKKESGWSTSGPRPGRPKEKVGNCYTKRVILYLITDKIFGLWWIQKK